MLARHIFAMPGLLQAKETEIRQCFWLLGEVVKQQLWHSRSSTKILYLDIE